MEITNHAKQRYSERIMDKNSKLDVNRFIIENEEKIKTDICKMIDYGQLIYEGCQKRDGKINHISVYLKDCWIILCDPIRETVITLYKVDLGLDDDFNKLYVSKMIERLNEFKEVYKSTKESCGIETKKYNEMIAENLAQINEYRGYIKNLEELNNSYKSITEYNSVQIDIAEKNMIKVMNDLIGKKEF